MEQEWRRHRRSDARRPIRPQRRHHRTTASSSRSRSAICTGPKSVSARSTVTTSPIAPSISSQPSSQTVTAGQTATFSVTATGTAPLSYQWSKNGATIAGAIGSVIHHASDHDVRQRSPIRRRHERHGRNCNQRCGDLRYTVTAAPTAPSISAQPSSQTVTAGQTATFSVTASGTTPFSYQWSKNGAAIAGATAASYTTPATTTADNGAQFTVTVNDTAGNATSSCRDLTVTAAPTAPSISAQPSSQTMTAGQTATFSVTRIGHAPLSYQWSKNGAAIAEARHRRPIQLRRRRHQTMEPSSPLR